MRDFHHDYRLGEMLRSTPSRLVVRAVRKCDERPVVLKVLHEDHATSYDLASLRHEHTIISSFNSPHIVQTLGLVRPGRQLGLVLEDLGDRCLESLIQPGGLPIQSLLELGLRVVDAVAAVHEGQVIHKDLKPEHFFVCGDEVKLIDFSIASQARAELPRDAAPHRLEGTLSYMSPEQTGRMNRALDRRTDLYSLGIVLYQLATGKLPFDSSDALEIVHCHMARPPPDPREHRADLPAPLCAILMKLLMKAAEDRYQQALGLKSDLQRCLQQWLTNARVDSFALGEDDARDVLRFGEELCGRSNELELLSAAFDRAQQGERQLATLSGPAGIGKSALVQALHGRKGFSGQLITVKPELRHRSVPYALITDGCRKMVQALLTQPPEVLQVWQLRLGAALGLGADFMVHWVPELRLVLNVAPSPAPPSAGVPAPHDFELTLERLVSTLALAAPPLLLFLDDLQLGDVASVQFLGHLLQQDRIKHLLVLVAYRGAELDNLSPLHDGLASLRDAIPEALNIELLGLDLEHTSALIARALATTPKVVQSLSAIVLGKTRGNPFFIRAFLSDVHHKQLLTYDRSLGRWCWDDDRLKTVQVTDNVVDTAIDALKQADGGTQQLLRLAACLGRDFDFATLTAISGQAASAVAAHVWEALRRGLLVPVDDGYRQLAELMAGQDPAHPLEGLNPRWQFVHDRVQHAAYATSATDHNYAVHLRIGQQLLQRTGPAPQGQLLFQIVDHLNMALELICDAEQRHSLAELNVRAGHEAKRAAAYHVASALFGQALVALDSGGWTTHYALAAEACLSQAECECLLGSPTLALGLLERAEQAARTTDERVRVRQQRLRILAGTGRVADACVHALDTLELLGLELCRDESQLQGEFAHELAETQRCLSTRSLETLTAADPAAQANVQQQVELLCSAANAALQYQPSLARLAMLRAMRLTIEHGNGVTSPLVFVNYAVAQAHATGERTTAYWLSQLGLGLGERVPGQAWLGAALLGFAARVSHHCTHISESLNTLSQACRLAFDAGDYSNAGPSAVMRAHYRFHSGEPLDELLRDVAQDRLALTRLGDRLHAAALESLEQGLAPLCERSGDTASKRAARALESDQPSLSDLQALAQALTVSRLYFTGQWEAVIAATDNTAFGHSDLFVVYDEALFRGLALVERASQAQGDQRDELRAALGPLCRLLAKAAELGRPNHAHRQALLLAELARVDGKLETALDQYELASTLAAENGFRQHAALASELCARFHERSGRNEVAHVYFMAAQRAYRAWGCHCKVTALSHKHGQLPSEDSARESWSPNLTPPRPRSVTAPSLRLDRVAAARATQAITSELVLERLVEQVMRIVIEHAGAQKGVLVLQRDERLEIAALATVDPPVMQVDLSDDVTTTHLLPKSVIQYAARTLEAVVLEEATAEPLFARDPYILGHRCRSLLCVTMAHKGRLIGLLYLENNGTSGAFHAGRVELLQFLAAQAAVAIENALLYRTLEQRVAERTREVEVAHANNVEAARRAGMAEVATGVLHNVGNALNSVNVSHELAAERNAHSKVPDLARALKLLEEHLADAAHFVTHDPRGMHLPRYLVSVAAHIVQGHEQLCQEVSDLGRHVSLVKDIVATHQSYAGLAAPKDRISPTALCDAVIRMQWPDLTQARIELIREYDRVQDIVADKTRLIQILANLLTNAHDALDDAEGAPRRVTLRVQQPTEQTLRFQILDTGSGIDPGVLPRLFTRGFTTKQRGHGFGLHDSARAAVQMGGLLYADSNGTGQGACFTLELPRAD